MSIKVELDGLEAEIASRGAGYLLTTGEDGRPHSTQVVFELDGAGMRAKAGRKTSANINRSGLVALLWPPTEAGSYSLIVDADATVDGPEGDHYAVITPTHAILHRPADGGGNDCAPVT